MLYITDIATDDSDDIILTDDVVGEESYSLSTIKVAERRLKGRYDDLPLDNCTAGLERYIQTRGKYPPYIIKSEIRRALGADNLLQNKDYDLVVGDIDQSGRMPITLRFNGLLLDTDDTFKILIDLTNQTSYR